MKQQLFFDLDGTLLDVSKKNYVVHQEIATLHHLTPLDFPLYWDRKRKHLPIWSDTSAAVEQYSLDFITRIESPDVLQMDTLIDGGETILRSLQKDFSLVLVTRRKQREHLLSQLESMNLHSFFIHVLTPSVQSKSDSIRDYSYAAHDIVIGDTEEDIIAAQELSIASIAVTWGLRDKQYLSRFTPTSCIDSPEYLIQTIKAVT